jgi:hypothetical protein
MQIRINRKYRLLHNPTIFQCKTQCLPCHFLPINAHDNEQGLFVQIKDPFTHSDSKKNSCQWLKDRLGTTFRVTGGYKKTRISFQKRVIQRTFTISMWLHWCKQKLYFRFSSQKDRQKLWKPSLKQKVLFWFLGPWTKIFLLWRYSFTRFRRTSDGAVIPGPKQGF